MSSSRVFLFGFATTVAVLAACGSHSISKTSGSADTLGGGGSAPAGYIDCDPIAGVKGLLPIDNSLSPMQQIGRCAWTLGTGRTTTNPLYAVDSNGNPAMAIEGLSGTENLMRNIAKANGTIVASLDVLSATSEADRVARWQQYGLMNDPGCQASSAPDQYGLHLDTCVDPYSAGLVGVRKFPNPNFDPNRWAQLQAQGQDALMQAYHTDPTLEPPYLVGQSCGSCHTSFDPANPPADPAHPTWANLKFTLGNQYFKEGEFFKSATNGPSDFRWHVLDTQEPGTSDTSRIANDHVNNPGSINPIYSLLFRPWHPEGLKQGQVTFDLDSSICPDLTTNCPSNEQVPVTSALALVQPNQAAKAIASIRRVVQSDGETHMVQSILKGGEDSVGPVGALLRVYVNIGMCSDQWLTHFDPVNGSTAQTPITVEELYNCPGYQQMLNRVPAIFLFLAAQGPIYLRDAPGGAAHIDDNLAQQGAIVFAQNCATCHSSKQPPAGTTDVTGWFTNSVQQDDWLLGNFFSDDQPHDVLTIGTNIGRARHSNHMDGHVWGDAYASQTYQQRTWPGQVTTENPYGDPVQYTGPDGGPGYYRTPTLISVWARAPLMHNRAMGQVDPNTNKMVIPGPGVDDRVAAFEAAAQMLLSPELRPKTTVNGYTFSGYVKTTSQDSVLSFDKLGLTFSIHVPVGMPVNLLANLDPTDLGTQAYFGGLAANEVLWNFDPTQWILGDLTYSNSGTHLLNLATSPDLVENKGHTFGSDLSHDQKTQLIEYLKTL